MPRVFVRYDALLADWKREVGRISHELAVDFTHGSREAVDRFLLPRPGDGTHGAQREVLPWVDTVYDRLCRAAAGEELDLAVLDAAFAAFGSAQAIELRAPSNAERALPDWDTKANWEEAAMRIAAALRSQ